MRIDLGIGAGAPALWRRVGAPAPSLGPYFPALSSPALAAWGARRMVEGYGGSLYRLRRGSDEAMAVAPAAGSDLPDYDAIASWAGGADLFVTDIYDQSGNGKDLAQPAAASQPAFDLQKALAGCVPFAFDGQVGTASGRKFMTTGTTLSFDRQDISIWQVVQPQFSANTQMYWNLSSGGDAGTLVCNCYQEVSAPGLRYFGSWGETTGSAGVPRAQPSVIGHDLGASAMRTIIRETSINGPAQGAGAGDCFTIGYAGQLGTGYESCHHCWATMLYPSLPDADQAALRAALETMFSVPVGFTSRIIFNGDSIMEGWRAGLLRSMPAQLAGLPGTPEIFNLAVSGRTQAAEHASFGAFIAPLFTAGHGEGKCLLVTNGGTNDIHNGASAAALQANALSYVADAQAAGFRVGLATLLRYGTDSDNPGQRAAYGDWVLAGSSGADFAIDAATAANMSDTGNATYYLDGVHPTGAGYASLASSRYGPALAVVLA